MVHSIQRNNFAAFYYIGKAAIDRAAIMFSSQLITANATWG
jgi:hypothetical protein